MNCWPLAFPTFWLPGMVWTMVKPLEEVDVVGAELDGGGGGAAADTPPKPQPVLPAWN